MEWKVISFALQSQYIYTVMSIPMHLKIPQWIFRNFFWAFHIEIFLSIFFSHWDFLSKSVYRLTQWKISEVRISNTTNLLEDVRSEVLDIKHYGSQMGLLLNNNINMMHHGCKIFSGRSWIRSWIWSWMTEKIYKNSWCI